MKHYATKRFWNCYNRLLPQIKNKANEQYLLMKENPQHPSLNFKPVGRFWSARVNINYRALAVKDKNECTWVWIGSHDEYDMLIKRAKK